MTSIPTRSEEYAKLMEHIRLAQESAAMLAHLHSADGDAKGMLLAKGWLAVSDLMKRMQHNVIELAKGNLQ